MLQRNSSAAQEQFAASVQALKANWVLCVESATMPWPKVMASAIPEIASMLDRMASDPRMQPIWIFLTTWPSEVREQFLKSVVLSARDAELTPKRRKQINEKLRHIAGARSAVRTLQKLGSKPLGTVCETLEGFVTNYAESLQPIESVLFHWERLHRSDLEKPIPQKDRGAATLRAEFMRRMVWWNKKLFGKPRYDDVAILANVLLDIGLHTRGEDVRAAARKADR